MIFQSINSAVFFREKSRNFAVRAENYAHDNDDDFENGAKLGEINLSNSWNLR